MEELGAEGGRRRGEGRERLLVQAPSEIVVLFFCCCFFGGVRKAIFLSTFSLPIENKWDKKVWLGGEGGGGRGRGGCEFNSGRSRVSR